MSLWFRRVNHNLKMIITNNQRKQTINCRFLELLYKHTNDNNTGLKVPSYDRAQLFMRPICLNGVKTLLDPIAEKSLKKTLSLSHYESKQIFESPSRKTKNQRIKFYLRQVKNALPGCSLRACS